VGSPFSSWDKKFGVAVADVEDEVVESSMQS